MDDPTSPKPNLLPVAKESDRPRGMSVAAQRVLFLLIGIGVGSVIVLGGLYLLRPPRVVYRTPPVKETPAVQSPPPLSNPQSLSESKPGVQPPKADAAKPGLGMPPFNPFDGSIASAMPPKEITGHIEPGPPPVLPNPSAGDTPPASQDVGPPKGLLLTVRLDVSDPDAAVKSLQALAARESGTAIQFDETASKSDAEGVVIFVPATKAEEAEKALATVGSVVATDRWTGSSGDRLDRIEANAQETLSALNLHRQELLVKYFEDAPQIKNIDEDSGRIKKCLAALHGQKSGPGIAVFKIKFLS